MTRYWLGVVSATHVQHGVQLGIAQINHGQRPPLVRMSPGDGFVYYSARTTMDGPSDVRSFTAIGTVADDEIWQGVDGDFHPWRRRVTYRSPVNIVPIADLDLELTGQPNWGYQLRRGLVELSERDFELIGSAMTLQAADQL